MLTRIALKGFKSFRELDLKLKPLCVLLGPNASGKSNFLDALQLLSRMATARTLKEAFEPPYRGKALESFFIPEGGIEELLKKDSASFTIEADVRLSAAVIDSVNREVLETRRPSDGHGPARTGGHEPRAIHHESLRYKITVEALPRSGVLRVADEYLAPLNKQGVPRASPKPFIERQGERLHLRMEGQSHPTYYDRFLDHSILSKSLYPPHHPHLTALQRELASWMFFYFEPRERMRASSPVKETKHIGLMGEDLASYLNTLKATNPRQFSAMEKALRMIVPSITGMDVHINPVGEAELRVREGDRLISARVASEGTLRVLGLLAMGGLKESPGLTGFEEPENGVHPRRVRLIAERLRSHGREGQRQLIITTHSPLLADQMPEDVLFFCNKVNGESRIEAGGDFALTRASDIASAADDEDVPISTRLMWGDLDA